MTLNIYEYIDYKKFLTDWRIAEKKKNPGLTHDYLCTILNQKNRTFYNDLEKGRKSISEDVLERLIKLHSLHGQEANYFRALVHYGQPTSVGDKEFWFERIIEMNNTPKNIIDKETFSYFKEWWHSAIRSTLDTCDMGDEYRSLASRLFDRITVNQVKDSIHLLSQLGLIAKNNKGHWKPTEKVLSTGNNVKDECLHRYQLANLDILRLVLEENKTGTYNSNTLTVSVSHKGLQRILNCINHFRSEIISIAHKDEEQAAGVYQISVHAIPMSRKN